MKIEKISENMIRVTISLDDLVERDIDMTSLNYNSPAAQELFWDMMEQAEDELGFNLTDSQLVIEPMPDSYDGFIITISRVDDEGDFESIHRYIRSRFKKTDLKLKKKNLKIFSALMIYSFKSFDDACYLCKSISANYTGISTLYRLKDIYYLTLTANSCSTDDIRTFGSLLTEYGTKIYNVDFYEGYLNEYAEKIVESKAVQTLSKHF
jgi:adapter protein MecA 1/2